MSCLLVISSVQLGALLWGNKLTLLFTLIGNMAVINIQEWIKDAKLHISP